MKIVIFGLSVTSSWGNGHATTFRSLLSALSRRGHKIVFFERDQEWYGSNRDLPEPSFCEVIIYQDWHQIRTQARRELSDCEVAVVGSYFPDGIAAIDTVLDSAAPSKAFYDIDTPITVAKLRAADYEYLRRDQIPGFDLYLSFTGGPLLQELQIEFGARYVEPLYCSVDPDRHKPVARDERFACDLSYMGTYAADRQPILDELFCKPALMLPNRRFLLAGSQYPPDFVPPTNIRRITHLSPAQHAAFYSSSALTLNLTRQQMIAAGYSPSVRLFEAAACGSAIVSDYWKGIETFFTPGEEILLAASAKDVLGYLTDLNRSELSRIGARARERAIAEHSSSTRALQFEGYVNNAVAKTKDVAPQNAVTTP